MLSSIVTLVAMISAVIAIQFLRPAKALTLRPIQARYTSGKSPMVVPGVLRALWPSFYPVIVIGQARPIKSAFFANSYEPKHSFTLIFDSFQGQVRPDNQLVDTRKYCQINLDLHYPQGFKYSVFQTIIREYTSLDPEVTTREMNSNQVTTSTVLYGLIDENYKIDSAVVFTGLI
ncbi:hypothetical protein EG329_008873 [Mollisiaceae sp. DMI_Dod_QoI]|nr:hypothetical protein EG329_008873 [Helotiales sp. DMI_Dod_QoI]